MINLLNELTTYLGEKLNLIPGTNIFYNSMPDNPDKCVVLTTQKHSVAVPPQIDASTHYLRVDVRAKTSDEAYQLAALCNRWLASDVTDYSEDTDTNGFITITNDLSVYVHLHGTPLWDKTDQQGRRYYYFTAMLITKKIV